MDAPWKLSFSFASPQKAGPSGFLRQEDVLVHLDLAHYLDMTSIYSNLVLEPSLPIWSFLSIILKSAR